MTHKWLCSYAPLSFYLSFFDLVGEESVVRERELEIATAAGELEIFFIYYIFPFMYFTAIKKS